MSLLDTASLLLTPNAYKEGKLYSVIPSDGSGDFTFTRATTATRVNSDGLVELVPYNLLQYSDNFSNAIWGKDLSSITYNQPDPFGGNNAALCTFTNLSTSRIFQNYSIVAGNTYTLSAWIKGVNITEFRFLLGTNQAVFVTSQIVNGEWVRVSATVTATTTGTYQQSPARTNNTNGESFYIYGAQFVEGTEALPYQKTETRLNIPRIDYSLGGCPNILLEPQRTNLALQSSSFDNATWLKTNATITADTTTAPDGTLTADLFTETTFTNSSATVGNSSLISVTSGVAYTTTVYAKKGNDKYLYLSNYYNLVNRYYTLIVDLESGTITKEQAGSSITSFSSSITSVGDGWYRISLTQTTAATQFYFILRISNSATPTIDASYGFITIPSNNNRSLYLWGAQLEAGAYATSYIPTTTASVTRNADQCFKTGISSLIGQTEGTLFVDFNAPNVVGFGIQAIVSLNNTNFINAYINNSGAILADVYVNGTYTFSLNGGVINSGQIKLAISYKSGDYKMYANGQLKASNANATILTSTISNIELKNTIAKGSFNSLQLYKTALTNAQLAQLTTI